MPPITAALYAVVSGCHTTLLQDTDTMLRGCCELSAKPSCDGRMSKHEWSDLSCGLLQVMQSQRAP